MEIIYREKIPEEVLLETTPVPTLMKAAEWGNEATSWKNLLFHGDNLGVLKALYDDATIRGRVQLVYIDPPYSKQRVFNHRTKLKQHAYDDRLAGYEFVEFLRRRLIFLRELMAEDGCIYVHLDTSMVFHAKVIMDEVFGEKNFRNLIARKKCHSKNYTRKQYGNVVDYILFYSKSEKMKWNRPYEKENIYSFEQRFPRVDTLTGRRYALVPIHAPGVRNGETGKPWRTMMPPKGKHWQVTPTELEALDARGEIYWSPTGNPRRKIFADHNKGVPVQDLWVKFTDFRNQNMKETGYPTEKNAAMMRRIVEASSDMGDLILDCFCGSGTTLAIAQQLGRRWIGVDSSDLAVETTLARIQKTEAGDIECAPEQLSLLDRHESDFEVTEVFTAFELWKTTTTEASLRSSVR